MEIRNSGAVKTEEENKNLSMGVNVKPKGTSSGQRTSGTPAYNFDYDGLPIWEVRRLPEDKIGETLPVVYNRQRMASPIQVTCQLLSLSEISATESNMKYIGGVTHRLRSKYYSKTISGWI